MNETHLIDGAMGRPHVNALDIRMHNASLFGDGVYITEGLDGLPVTVVDANTVSVGRGVMLINGARITQEEKIDLTIESGSQGMNRNDLLVATYTYDAANTRCEDVNLEIVTGTPTAGTATDPAIHSGTLLDINNADLVEGVSTVQVPIARIPLTGTTVGTPVILAKKFDTIQGIRDSVSPTQLSFTTHVSIGGGNVSAVRSGNVVVLSFFCSISELPSNGNTTKLFSGLPEALVVTRGFIAAQYSNLVADLRIGTDGTVIVTNKSDCNDAYWVVGSLVYIAAK